MCILEQVLKVIVGAMFVVVMMVVVFGGFAAGEGKWLHIGSDS